MRLNRVRLGLQPVATISSVRHICCLSVNFTMTGYRRLSEWWLLILDDNSSVSGGRTIKTINVLTTSCAMLRRHREPPVSGLSHYIGPRGRIKYLYFGSLSAAPRAYRDGQVNRASIDIRPDPYQIFWALGPNNQVGRVWCHRSPMLTFIAI